MAEHEVEQLPERITLEVNGEKREYRRMQDRDLVYLVMAKESVPQVSAWAMRYADFAFRRDTGEIVKSRWVLNPEQVRRFSAAARGLDVPEEVDPLAVARKFVRVVVKSMTKAELLKLHDLWDNDRDHDLLRLFTEELATTIAPEAFGNPPLEKKVAGP